MLRVCSFAENFTGAFRTCWICGNVGGKSRVGSDKECCSCRLCSSSLAAPPTFVARRSDPRCR